MSDKLEERRFHVQDCPSTAISDRKSKFDYCMPLNLQRLQEAAREVRYVRWPDESPVARATITF